jgi:hypothetical protein
MRLRDGNPGGSVIFGHAHAISLSNSKLPKKSISEPERDWKKYLEKEISS